MSPLQSKDISEEMYHRVYRLIKRNLNPHTIAATLNLPVRTVLGVINRIEKGDTSGAADADGTTTNSNHEPQEYLDIYSYPKTRYAILDLVGALTDTFTEKLQGELEKTITSSWKAVAVRMSDVSVLSENAGNLLVQAREKFNQLGRFLAILDPASAIESSLITYNIEPTVPVFGTESAFEDAAFSKKATTFARRGGSQSS